MSDIVPRSSTFSVQWLLKISPHLKRVATLPCKYLKGFHKMILTFHKVVWWRGWIFNDHFIACWVCQRKNFENRPIFVFSGRYIFSCFNFSVVYVCKNCENWLTIVEVMAVIKVWPVKCLKRACYVCGSERQLERERQTDRQTEM